MQELVVFSGICQRLEWSGTAVFTWMRHVQEEERKKRRTSLFVTHGSEGRFHGKDIIEPKRNSETALKAKFHRIGRFCSMGPSFDKNY